MKMRSLATACGFIVILTAAQLLAQCDKPQTKLDEKTDQELSALVSQANACTGPADCGSYLGKALKAAYGVDIGNKTAHDLIRSIKNDSSWSDLGAASDQSILDKGQEAANCKKAVVAVWTGADGGGHAVVLLPGSESASSSWKLKAPNSASFFVNNPKKSFAGKPMSYAFTSPGSVELYTWKQ